MINPTDLPQWASTAVTYYKPEIFEDPCTFISQEIGQLITLETSSGRYHVIDDGVEIVLVKSSVT